jgi:hypothetical protein
MAKTNEEILQIIYFGLVFVGAILAIISLSVTTDSSANLSISSYTFLSAGIILMIVLLSNKIKTGGSTMEFLSAFITNTGPLLLLLGIIGYTLYLIITFKDKIDSGSLSDSYGLFSKLSICFILMQLYIIYNGMQNANFRENGTISKMNSSYSYLAGVINVFIVVTLSTILFYFTTDG